MLKYRVYLCCSTQVCHFQGALFMSPFFGLSTSCLDFLVCLFQVCNFHLLFFIAIFSRFRQLCDVWGLTKVSPPSYQKIALKLDSKARFSAKFECLRSARILFVGIKYSTRDSYTVYNVIN